MNPLLKQILPLGDRRLRRPSMHVDDVRDPAFLERAARLKATLAAFRDSQGFGRAIAAPQIGIEQRFIALELDAAPDLVINPEIIWKSDETFTMWDDCMSFPALLVRVRRHRSISVRYTDAEGKARDWDGLDIASAELLQHEIDHLDGVLALDRALDRTSIISREAYEADRERFRAEVDYVIGD